MPIKVKIREVCEATVVLNEEAYPEGQRTPEAMIAVEQQNFEDYPLLMSDIGAERIVTIEMVG